MWVLDKTCAKIKICESVDPLWVILSFILRLVVKYYKQSYQVTFKNKPDIYFFVFAAKLQDIITSYFNVNVKKNPLS